MKKSALIGTKNILEALKSLVSHSNSGGKLNPSIEQALKGYDRKGLSAAGNSLYSRLLNSKAIVADKAKGLNTSLRRSNIPGQRMGYAGTDPRYGNLHNSVLRANVGKADKVKYPGERADAMNTVGTRNAARKADPEYAQELLHNSVAWGPKTDMGSENFANGFASRMMGKASAAHAKGFMDTCAYYGVDPEQIIKVAQDADTWMENTKNEKSEAAWRNEQARALAEQKRRDAAAAAHEAKQTNPEVEVELERLSKNVAPASAGSKTK